MPDASKYSHFLTATSLRLREQFLFPPECSELELQSLWFSGALGRSFTTTTGKTVEIIQFGHWNHSAGPDFTDTAIALDGQRLKGAIELDTDVRDWEHHRHSINPDYNQVILHIFFSAPDNATAFTRSSDHRDIPQIKLDPATLTDLFDLPRFEADAHLGRCATPLQDMPDDHIESLLVAAAKHRLTLKGRRLHRSAEIHGPDEALFQGIAQTLGYRPNKLSMTILAQRLPLRILQSHGPLEGDAILLGSAGFLESESARYDSTPPEARDYLKSLWELWWKQRSHFAPAEDRRLPWTLSGNRPGNHPQRRIAALALIAARWDRLKRTLRDPASFSEDQFRSFFHKLDHPFWSHHYTLKADPADKPVALVGPSRIDDLLANQIYPYLIEDVPDLWTQYAKLPAKLDNVRLKRALTRLFGTHPRRESFAKKVYQQQALLQIYQDFCLEDDSACQDCPFPEQLRQWR
ncbi:MAG: DUF2851 family protein [Verrucomicrobiota bacterium]